MLFSKQNNFSQYKNQCVFISESQKKQWKSQNKCTDPPIHTNMLIYHCACPSRLGLTATDFYWKTECHTGFPKMASTSEDLIKAANAGSRLRLAGARRHCKCLLTATAWMHVHTCQVLPLSPLGALRICDGHSLLKKFNSEHQEKSPTH